MAEIRRRNAGITFVEDERHDDETLIAAVGDDDVQYAIVGGTPSTRAGISTTMRNARSLSSRRYRASGCCTWDMKLRDEAEAFFTHHA